MKEKNGPSTQNGPISDPPLSCNGQAIRPRLQGLGLQKGRQRRQVERRNERLLLQLREAREALEHRVEESASELQQARSKLRALSAQILKIQEIERRRIARELHDGIGQEVTGLKLLMSNTLKTLPPEAAGSLKEVERGISEVLEEIRQLALDLRPHMLDERGLLAALKWHFKGFHRRTGIRIQFTRSHISERSLSPEVKITLFRVVQEALTNIAKHAHVSRASVELRAVGSEIRVDVVDHGIGFDMADIREGTSSGISSMRERIALAQGQWRIRSKKGEGTRISVKLPLIRETK